ncbi:MAG: hypothetical protein HFF70_07125, partial [Oscillospiraceae bacterium]|nr:hypothetical protein [Oscillospiraceae bacterium]
TVAEILFQAILVNMVDHNILNTNNGNQGYTEIDETLGYKTFKLEQVEGVVTANEFADLYSDQVLSEGRTNLEIAENDIRSLAITTEITDIGESRYAYITGSKVLAMGDTGNNKVTEFGHACDISSASKFNAVAEMSAASGIEYYVDFGRSGYWTSDFRIEYIITFANEYGGYKDAAAYNEAAQFADNALVYWRNDGKTLNRVIPAGQVITLTDYDNMRNIFTWSNGVWDKDTDKFQEGFEIGQVYVATQTKEDISDKISFNQFVEDYLNDKTFNDSWGISYNGQWVKFVDNNGDGQAEYAFKTNSWLDEALETYTNKDGETVTVFNRFDDNNDPRSIDGDYQVRYMNGETPAVGDKVICAWIDNQILVEPANDVTKTVKSYSWRDDEITCTDDEILGQSGIGNATDMLQLIATMADKTEYIMYLDHFGYVRAYEWPGATDYVLVTEIYARNNANGNLVRDWPMTVELKNKDEKPAEYGLNGGGNNLFVANQPFSLIWNLAATSNYYNWLLPATGHVGVNAVNYAPKHANPTFGADTYLYWENNRARYAVDYVQLSTDLPVAAGAVRYPIGGTPAYVTANNDYVNAVHDTQYYIVHDNGVEYFTDFTHMPALTADNVGEIHAAYAVAKDISSDNADAPYWVADVIVFEVQNWNNDKAGSVALAYYTPSRTTGNVQNIDTINAKYGLTSLIPGNKAWSADQWQWGADWDGYGFYKLINETEPVDNVMTASKITRIENNGANDRNYGKNNIHAGIVTREAYLAGNGYYIDVDMSYANAQPWLGARANTQPVIASIEITDKIYSVTTGSTHQGYPYDYNEAELLRYKNANNSQVKAGDLIVWVGEAKSSAVNASGILSATNFVVDLGNPVNNADLFNKTASFLLRQDSSWKGEWINIMDEQAAGSAPVDAPMVKFYGVEDNGIGDKNSAYNTITVSYATASKATNANFLTVGDGKWTITPDAPKSGDTISKTGQTWTLSIYGDDERFYTYTLVLEAIGSVAKLESTNSNVATVDQTTGEIDVKDNNLSINQFVSYFMPKTGVKWTFKTAAGNTITDWTQKMDAVATIEAVVTAEDGVTTATYYKKGGAATVNITTMTGNGVANFMLYGDPADPATKISQVGADVNNADGTVSRTYAVTKNRPVYAMSISDTYKGTFWWSTAGDPMGWAVGTTFVATPGKTDTVNGTTVDLGINTSVPRVFTEASTITFKNDPIAPSTINIALVGGSGAGDIGETTGANVQNGDIKKVAPVTGAFTANATGWTTLSGLAVGENGADATFEIKVTDGYALYLTGDAENLALAKLTAGASNAGKTTWTLQISGAKQNVVLTLKAKNMQTAAADALRIDTQALTGTAPSSLSASVPNSTDRLTKTNVTGTDGLTVNGLGASQADAEAGGSEVTLPKVGVTPIGDNTVYVNVTYSDAATGTTWTGTLTITVNRPAA